MQPGLSGHEPVYTASEGSQFPIKWTAPEALRFNIFSVKSDVWSFGILMWEIYTLGSNPYPGVSLGDVLPKLDTGYRMPQPPRCPHWLYGCMLQCWQIEPDHRLTFDELKARIDGGALANTADESTGDAAVVGKTRGSADFASPKKQPPAVAVKPKPRPQVPTPGVSATAAAAASGSSQGGTQLHLRSPSGSVSTVHSNGPSRTGTEDSDGGGGDADQPHVDAATGGASIDLVKKTVDACRRVMSTGHALLQHSADPGRAPSVEELLIDASDAYVCPRPTMSCDANDDGDS